MVATRRKSAISYKEPQSDDEMDVDVAPVDEKRKTSKKSATRATVRHDSDDDDIEFDSEEDAKPKRKKTKTTAGAVKGKKGKGKVTARSMMKDLFSTLPLDLIYEVFGHLHPLDLWHLARTNKMLRTHLMSKRSISVWKTAREAVNPPVPECPKDQSEPQWAVLLFTHNCTMCGTPRIQKADWNLRLRGCDYCFKNHIVYRKTAKKRYPDVKNLDDILDLLPWTNTGGWAHGRASSSKYYYSAAITRMIEIVDDYQLRVDAGVKGARADLDSFKGTKKLAAKEQFESGAALREWAAETAQLKSDAGAEAKTKRKEAMIAKLIDLGHDPRDVQKAANSWYTDQIFRVTTQLSEAVWKRVKSKAEELVDVEKQSRLEIEMKATRDARRNVAKIRFDDFKKSYDSSPDNLMPSHLVFKDFPLVKAAIQREDTEVSPTIFDGAFEGLAQVLDEWRRERRVHLAKRIIDARPGPKEDKPDPIVAEKEGILYLATSLFSTCDRRPRWFADLPRHFTGTTNHWGYENGTFTDLRCVSVPGDIVQSVADLVRLAGLDPETALSKDMDDLGARFWCKDCSINGAEYARTWRNSVLHYRQHLSRWRPFNRWEVISAEDRVTIATRETEACSYEKVDWNLVAMSLDGRAVTLVGGEYKIKTSQAGPSSTKSSTTPLPSDDNLTYKCRLCPENREFILGEVAKHTREAHGIINVGIPDLWLFSIQ
ncbi:hypothetical protein FRB90_000304 [Tulasnella sp. 427]|nr:hypothetical protein FRB90_000304 [Tulasnella sp. 427]